MPRARRRCARAAGEVRFDHVDFHYETNRQILFDVSFAIPAGRTVAVVGPSGSGKSTLARLLYRFYDVSGGRIAIDGQDVRAVQQASVRAAIGIVPQDTVLFNDSIEYNIAYGRPDATRDEIMAAARLAQIHDFVIDVARRLCDAGRRARAQAVRRREAARRDRARDTEESAHSHLRRSDLSARFGLGKADPGRARADLRGPHDADHRASLVDDRPRRPDTGARRGSHRRARHPRRPPRRRRARTRACGRSSSKSDRATEAPRAPIPRSC